MSKPEGITKRTKDNSRKKSYEREQWMKGKKIGRPKQVWVPSMLKGVVINDEADLGEIAEIINDGSISGYTRAHWEKVKE